MIFDITCVQAQFEVIFDTHECEVCFISIIKQKVAAANDWYSICNKILRMIILYLSRPKALI